MADEFYDKIQRRNRMPTEQLLALPDDSELVGGVYCRIAPNGNPTDLESQNGPQTVVTLVSVTHGIIGNGGLEYLFEGWYPGDLDYSLTLNALISIGATEWSIVFSEVLAALPSYNMPDEVEARHLTFLNIPEPKRDKWFGRLLNSENELIAKLATYIRKNRDSFTMLQPLE